MLRFSKLTTPLSSAGRGSGFAALRGNLFVGPAIAFAARSPRLRRGMIVLEAHILGEGLTLIAKVVKSCWEYLEIGLKNCKIFEDWTSDLLNGLTATRWLIYAILKSMFCLHAVLKRINSSVAGLLIVQIVQCKA